MQSVVFSRGGWSAEVLQLRARVQDVNRRGIVLERRRREGSQVAERILQAVALQTVRTIFCVQPCNRHRRWIVISHRRDTATFASSAERCMLSFQRTKLMLNSLIQVHASSIAEVQRLAHGIYIVAQASHLPGLQAAGRLRVHRMPEPIPGRRQFCWL